MNTVKPRKFTVQLTLQELDVITAYLIDPASRKPWPEMAKALEKRGRTWRQILRRENPES
jgi:hypothetical protein